MVQIKRKKSMVQISTRTDRNFLITPVKKVVLCDHNFLITQVKKEIT